MTRDEIAKARELSKKMPPYLIYHSEGMEESISLPDIKEALTRALDGIEKLRAVVEAAKKCLKDSGMHEDGDCVLVGIKGVEDLEEALKALEEENGE